MDKHTFKIAVGPQFALQDLVNGFCEATREGLDRYWSGNKEKGRLERVGKSGHEDHGMAPMPYAHGLVRESLRPRMVKGKLDEPVCVPCSEETALHIEAACLGGRESWDRLMAQLTRK